MKDLCKHVVLKRMGSTPSTPPAAQLSNLNEATSHRRTLSLLGQPLPALPQSMECHSNPQANAVEMEARDEQHVKHAESSTNISQSNGNTGKPDVSSARIFLYTALVISAVCVFLYVGRDYIKLLLLSLERTNVWMSLVIFSILFTVVSFPMTWGYILLNIAVGYLYGVLTGILIVVTCAIFGVFTAHHVIRRCLRDFVWEHLANESIRSIIRVVEQGSGLKVIVLARLSPIPFGLQNALFAMANISLQRYLLASFLGMLPSQGLHVYIGSTLRSMEEVISSNSSSTLAYYVFAAQILIAVVLFVFTLRKAREEFNKTLEEVKVINDVGWSDSASFSRILNYESRDPANDRSAKERKPTILVL